jgi:hypothetical protein
MQKLTSFSLFFIVILFITSCKKKEEITPDKQIRFNIVNTNGLGINTIEGGQAPEEYNLIKFNKDFYDNIESIVLAGQIRSSDPSANCIVELVNVTDNIIYSSSQIKGNSTSFSLATSGNFISDLPGKEITLSVRIRTDKEGIVVEANQINLFLYRK